MEIPVRELGRTGVRVTQLGLGGEGVLRTFGHDREAAAVIDRALEEGVGYLESARAYSGSESYYGQSLKERREKIFLASKSHDRTAPGARSHLETTLKNMQTDHLDLWQVHDVRSRGDLDAIFGSGGAIEAFDAAKKDGLVRFVGITGHEDPQILLKAFDLYDFDTVLLPVNPAEPAHRSFVETVLPEARRRGMGVIGMKVLCRGFALRVAQHGSVDPWIRYALARDVSTLVIGCDTPDQVSQNVRAACLDPLPEDDCRQLEKAVAPYARELMYYKP